jgi:predicted transcriptional regulator
LSGSDFVQRQVVDIDRRLGEIDAALGGWDDLVQERERLRAARAVLVGGEPAPEPSVPARSAAAQARAPRGENRRRLLEAVEQRPGASVGELAQTSGLARPTAYNTLRALLERGEVQRVDLGGGQVGYRRAEPSQAGQDEQPEVDSEGVEPDTTSPGP